VTRLEYRFASAVLLVLGWLFAFLPARTNVVVLASPRKRALDGNLLAIRDEIRARRPAIRIVELAETYGYGLRGKALYAIRMARAMYHLRTAGLVVLDNAWLPVHVAPHPKRTTVVQVWHAAGALKRFGVDTVPPPREPERTFLHRHYDWVVASGEASRVPWSRALRTDLEHVLALGAPRTDLLLDPAALAASRARVLARYPALHGRRVITYAPTFRGRGRDKSPARGLDAARLRAALGPGDVLVLKSHPNLDFGLVLTAGFDVVIDHADDMNDVLAATDVLVTDYSSAIFEYALLRRPMVLLVPDLETYEREPGMYVDYRTQMIGTQVRSTDEVAAAIAADAFDLAPYDAFIRRHLGLPDGHSSQRFVDRFLPG
jgi:CDP-glycerol glycerophosphotransferase (TagB/SpsB family)